MRLTLYPVPLVEASRLSALEAWSALTAVPPRIALEPAAYHDWREEWNDLVFWIDHVDEWVTPEDQLFRYPPQESPRPNVKVSSPGWVIKRLAGKSEQIVGILPGFGRFDLQTHINRLWRDFGLLAHDYYSLDPVASSTWTPDVSASAKWLDDAERKFQPKDVVASFRMSNIGGIALIRGDRVTAYLMQYIY